MSLLKLERWQLSALRSTSFAELWDEGTPTLKWGVRFHRYCGVWLVKNGVNMAGSYPAQHGLVVREWMLP